MGQLLKVNESLLTEAECWQQWGYYGIALNQRDDTLKKPVFQLTRADGRELITRMEKAGLSRNYQKKVKNIVNSCF